MGEQVRTSRSNPPNFLIFMASRMGAARYAVPGIAQRRGAIARGRRKLDDEIQSVTVIYKRCLLNNHGVGRRNTLKVPRTKLS